ncbi:MAG: CoA synthetase [SAR324 cluster bacterium]|nr:CoA synthetase [SAR324 cluster bacterium]MCH8888475.1 CoA synthetase [SAR324 cluster bacterium]
MAESCTGSELIAVLLSREVREGELSACGALSMIPAAGLLLAQATHAPKAELLMLGTPLMPFATSRQFHFLAMRGDLGLFFVSGVQIDRRGNYNLHMLGEDQDKPRVRFPGGYGGGMIYYAARRTVVFRTEHSRRALVEQVDFISAAGRTPPEVLRHGGPTKVITPMATLGFDAKAGVLGLESAHPPHTPGEVQERTGFHLGDLSGVPATPAPTEAELKALRGPVRLRMIEEGIYAEWARANLGGETAA